MRGWRCRCLSAASADDRSIGLFRVVVAACLLLELAGSWPDRCEFYSEEGVLPLGDDDTTLILHRGHTCSVTTALFVVHGFAAAMLLMGVWSRCSAALAYALQLSLLHRNPHVQTGDACLLCMCLLWAALLPTIGARWRVPTRATAATAKAAPPSSSAPSSAPSVAALGLKVSVALFYLTSAVIKARERRHTSRAPGLGDRESSRSPSPWLAGTAVAEALTCCEYRTALGDILLAAPSACIVLTYATLGLEAAGPGLLLLLDSVERLVVLVLFLGMHLAMHLTMELGHFSLIATGALCAFVPSDGWLLLSAVLEAMALPSLLPSVRTAAPRSPPPPPPPHDGVQRVRTGTLPSMVGGVLSSLLLVAAVAVSIESLDTENLARSRQRPRDDSRLPAFPLALFASVGRSLGVPPRADMFAPPPQRVRPLGAAGDARRRPARRRLQPAPLAARQPSAAAACHRPTLDPAPAALDAPLAPLPRNTLRLFHRGDGRGGSAAAEPRAQLLPRLPAARARRGRATRRAVRLWLTNTCSVPRHRTPARGRDVPWPRSTLQEASALQRRLHRWRGGHAPSGEGATAVASHAARRR